jgi:hypothetical protein
MNHAPSLLKVTALTFFVRHLALRHSSFSDANIAQCILKTQSIRHTYHSPRCYVPLLLATERQYPHKVNGTSTRKYKGEKVAWTSRKNGNLACPVWERAKVELYFWKARLQMEFQTYIVLTHVQVLASQSLTRLSSPTVANNEPSTLKAIDLMASPCSAGLVLSLTSTADCFLYHHQYPSHFSNYIDCNRK